jgi:hypothetical protein
MLRKTYAAQDEIPEALRDHYTDTGNGWQLELDAEADAGPAVDLTRYREMRDNNIKMKAQLEELMTEQQQIRDQYKTMLDKAQGEEEAQLLKSGQFDEVLERRTQAIKSEYQKQLEDLHQQREAAEQDKAAARQRFGSVYLGEQLATALERKKLRLRPTARADLLTRAGGTFQPNDAMDALVATNHDVDGMGKELTIDDWLDRTVTEAPHLFDGGDGGGARPGGAAGGNRIRMADVRDDPAAFLQASERVARGEASWSE